MNFSITREYFNLLKPFTDKYVRFIRGLQEDIYFQYFLKNYLGIKEHNPTDVKGLIHIICLGDLCKCFNEISNLFNSQNKEGFAIMYLKAKLLTFEPDNYERALLLYTPNIFQSFKEYYETNKYSSDNSSIENDRFFQLSFLLSYYKKELQNKYLSNLYHFASIVTKADGMVTPREEMVLGKIMKGVVNKEEEKTASVKAPVPDQSLEEVLIELNELIGLTEVKNQIKSLVNFVRIQKAREGSGLKSSSLSYHIVFTGNPGTGKTTVARIVSKIYKALGVIKSGHLVETDRSGLVAEYLGQTAVKVNKIVDSAINGILFIDEAYAIEGGNQDSYGKEAVATLMKRIEDDRDKLVVILAGYTDEMNRFMDINPGFKSRFNRYIDFPDYTPNELLDIFKHQCSKLDYSLNNNALNLLEDLFFTSYTYRDKNFGNGRFVRNVFEKALENQANRLASVSLLNKEILTTITAEDIPQNNLY